MSIGRYFTTEKISHFHLGYKSNLLPEQVGRIERKIGRLLRAPKMGSCIDAKHVERDPNTELGSPNSILQL